jgi:hypothetical protein
VSGCRLEDRQGKAAFLPAVQRCSKAYFGEFGRGFSIAVGRCMVVGFQTEDQAVTYPSEGSCSMFQESSHAGGHLPIHWIEIGPARPTVPARRARASEDRLSPSIFER